MQALEKLVDALERLPATDAASGRIQRVVRRAVGHGELQDALTGRWLGHAVHPMLTDLPIGFWTSAWTLDLIGGARSRAAAQRLVGLGVLSAIPAIATGMTDWSDTSGPQRRVGAVHAALNSAAVLCFAASWHARRRGRTAKGVLWGFAGSAVATGGGYLGGHLTQRLGLGIDTTAFDEEPDGWTPTRPADEWAEATPRRVDVPGAEVVVVHERGRWHALDRRCSHRGGPLDEGTVRDGCVECPWHGSRFRLDDGSVAQGPAAAPQPALGVRVVADVVQVGPRTTTAALPSPPAST